MSDANLSTLAFVRESTLGTTPADGLKRFRFTKEGLGFGKETVTSAEVRADRQVADSVKVFGQPSGPIDFEVSFNQLRPVIGMVLMADWNIGTTTASADFSGATITGGAGDFINVPVNGMIVIRGAENDENNGIFRVVSKNSDSSVLTCAAAFTTETGALIDVSWKTIRPGSTKIGGTFEKRFVISDAAKTDYLSFFRGMMADSLDLTIESKKIVTASLSLIGMSYDIGTVSSDPQYANGSIATVTLNFTTNPADGDTVNIGASQGGKVYSFETGTLQYTNQIKVGATASDTVDNLIAAINGTADADVGPDTAPHSLVTAARGSGNSIVISARESGAAGNRIEVSEESTALTFSAGALTGGTDPATGYLDSPTDAIVNGTNNFGTLKMNGSASSEKFKSIKIKLANNLRGKDACGVDGNFDIGLGRFEVTGSFNAYFRDSTIQENSQLHSSVSIEFYLENVDGSRLYCFMPCLKLTGDPKVEGVNTDVMIDSAFEGVIGDASAGTTIIFDYFDATE